MDPTLKTKTTAALKEGILKFSPQMKTAAKYVIDYPSDFGLDSIRETARKARVSTYTLVNMAKTLGFESFEAFRQPYRHALVAAAAHERDPDWIASVRAQSEFGQIYADASKNALSIVTHSLERQKLQDGSLFFVVYLDPCRTKKMRKCTSPSVPNKQNNTCRHHHHHKVVRQTGRCRNNCK